ncbi:hypothetical protein Efla_006449 [Eimeria flavescens]
MRGPTGGPHPGGPPGLTQSKLPLRDPQSKAAKRSRAIIKEQKRLETKAKESAAAVASLLTEQEGFIEAEGLEQTYKFSQADILEHVAPAARKKASRVHACCSCVLQAFELRLSFGPYTVDYTRGGRELLLGGQRGSLALLDCQSLATITEINVKETVRDVRFLHNHTLWAAAQKKYVYIYDKQGVEVHCLRDLMLTYRLDFLPYHYLMVSIGEFGQLVYYDISTGQIAAKHNTKRGPCSLMRQNPSNAVIHLGHSKGTVSLWTPNLGKARQSFPAVEMFCHKGRVSSLAVQGHHLITAGVDGKWKLWDLRKYESVHSFHYFGAPPSTIDISQTGLVAIGFGSHVQLWKDVLTGKKPSLYLTHETPGEQVSCLRFRPFEDICAAGTSGGVSCLLVPGAGLANYDALEANPYETKRQRQEREIQSLLEKLPADMISLDPSPIGAFDRHRKAAPPPEEPLSFGVCCSAEKRMKKPKNKQRGRSTPEKRSQKSEREQLIKKRHLTAVRLAASKSKNKRQASSPSESEVTGALARCVSPQVYSCSLLQPGGGPWGLLGAPYPQPSVAAGPPLILSLFLSSFRLAVNCLDSSLEDGESGTQQPERRHRRLQQPGAFPLGGGDSQGEARRADGQTGETGGRRSSELSA